MDQGRVRGGEDDRAFKTSRKPQLRPAPPPGRQLLQGGDWSCTLQRPADVDAVRFSVLAHYRNDEGLLSSTAGLTTSPLLIAKETGDVLDRSSIKCTTTSEALLSRPGTFAAWRIAPGPR